MPHLMMDLPPLHEIIRGLEDLVKEGEILYTGLINFPVWKVAANDYTFIIFTLVAVYI